MGLEVERYEDSWYFSKHSFGGLGAERTLAIYKPKRRELTITRRGFKPLTSIFRYLQKHLDTTSVAVVWYKEKR